MVVINYIIKPKFLKILQVILKNSPFLDPFLDLWRQMFFLKSGFFQDSQKKVPILLY